MNLYRASALGGCMKALVAARMGFTEMDPPDKMQTIFTAGHDWEVLTVDELQHRGYHIVNQQREVDIIVSSDVMVRGHIDGQMQLPDWNNESKWYVAEIKSMAHDRYEEWIEKRWDTPGLVQKYKWQVSAYMHALAEELMFVVRDRSTGDQDISFVEKPFYTREEIVAKVLTAEVAARKGELPACDVPSYPCPFFYLHDEKRKVVEDPEVSVLAGGYLAARAKENVAKMEIVAFREGIMDALTARGVESLTVDEATITSYETTRKSLDKKKLAEDGVDVSKYEKSTVSRGLRVTARGEDGGLSSDG